MINEVIDAIEKLIDAKIFAQNNNHTTAVKEKYEQAKEDLTIALIEWSKPV